LVVKVAIATGRRACSYCQCLACAAVLFAGVVILPTQSDSQTLFSSGAEHAIGPTRTGIYSQPFGSPDFASPTGSVTLALSVAFGWSAVRPISDAQGVDSAVTKMLDAAVSTDSEELNIGPSGAGRIVASPVQGEIRAVCTDDQLIKRIQTAGAFWSHQAVSAEPAQFARGLLTERSLKNANRVGDPTNGPSGDRSNLFLPGPGAANGWCRPLPLPFSKSSPLANRSLWIVAAIALMVGLVFGLSRGVRVPA
jgi:hypothetical protein